MKEKSSSDKLDFLNNGIAQVAIIVEDLDTAVKNYWDIFGIGPWHIYTYKKPLVKRMSYKGETADYKMRLALSRIGSLRIELIEILEGESIYSDFVKKHGYGVHHFGILVDDTEKKIAEAAFAGIKMVQDGSGFGKRGDGHYAYIDTEEKIGVTLEFIEPPEERVAPDKVYPPEKKMSRSDV